MRKKELFVDPGHESFCQNGSSLFQKKVNIRKLETFTPLYHTMPVTPGNVPYNCLQTTLLLVDLIPRLRAQYDSFHSELTLGHMDTKQKFIDYVIDLIPGYNKTYVEGPLDNVNAFIELIDRNLTPGYGTIVTLTKRNGPGHLAYFFKLEPEDGMSSLQIFDGQRREFLDGEEIIENIKENEWDAFIVFCVSNKRSLDYSSVRTYTKREKKNQRINYKTKSYRKSIDKKPDQLSILLADLKFGGKSKIRRRK
jgi:hypothetical protein